MAHTAPATWLADVLAPLGSAFAGDLRFARDGECACWTYEGHRASIELEGERVRARFVDSEAVYARDGGYPLTPAGCQRMVADMIAFFSGVREPQFTFIGLR